MNIFTSKQPSLQPAIQKYKAIDEIVSKKAIICNYEDCSCTIIPELWNIYPEKKHKDVLSNILFYINTTNAFNCKNKDNKRLLFTIKDSSRKGIFENGKITYMNSKDI